MIHRKRAFFSITKKLIFQKFPRSFSLKKYTTSLRVCDEMTAVITLNLKSESITLHSNKVAAQVFIKPSRVPSTRQFHFAIVEGPCIELFEIRFCYSGHADVTH